MKKNSRKALLASIVSLVICCTMLLGTTMAWFTDSVTSSINTIKAGNLKIGVYAGDEQITGADTDPHLFDVDLWEPGVYVYENITVKNEGSLALKYKMSVNVGEATTVNGKTLEEVLKFAVIPYAITGDMTEDRDAVKELITSEDSGVITYDSLDSAIKGVTYLYPADSADEDHPSEATVAIVVFWEPGANDNDFNLSNGKRGDNEEEALTIELGINVEATQLTYEKDSFDDKYDAGATYADGSSDDEEEDEPTTPETPVDPEEKCTHPNDLLSTSYTYSSDGTHTVTVACSCTHVVSTTTEDCTDANHDGSCDLECGATDLDIVHNSLTAVWNNDSTGHWHIACTAPKCTEYNVKTDFAVHYTEDGNNVCDVCDYTPVNCTEGEHDYEETAGTPATCTENGEKTYTCSKCGDSYTATINATGHTYEEIANDDYIASKATCVVAATYYESCSVCQEKGTDTFTYGNVDTTNHTNTRDVEAVASTCTEVGYTAGVYCDDCANYISGHDEVKATGHNWTDKNGVCKNNSDHECTHETYENGACTVCGAEEVPAIPSESFNVNYNNSSNQQFLDTTDIEYSSADELVITITGTVTVAEGTDTDSLWFRIYPSSQNGNSVATTDNTYGHWASAASRVLFTADGEVNYTGSWKLNDDATMEGIMFKDLSGIDTSNLTVTITQGSIYDIENPEEAVKPYRQVEDYIGTVTGLSGESAEQTFAIDSGKATAGTYVVVHFIGTSESDFRIRLTTGSSGSWYKAAENGIDYTEFNEVIVLSESGFDATLVAFKAGPEYNSVLKNLTLDYVGVYYADATTAEGALAEYNAALTAAQND